MTVMKHFRVRAAEVMFFKKGSIDPSMPFSLGVAGWGTLKIDDVVTVLAEFETPFPLGSSRIGPTTWIPAMTRDEVGYLINFKSLLKRNSLEEISAETNHPEPHEGIGIPHQKVVAGSFYKLVYDPTANILNGKFFPSMDPAAMHTRLITSGEVILVMARHNTGGGNFQVFYDNTTGWIRGPGHTFERV